MAMIGNPKRSVPGWSFKLCEINKSSDLMDKMVEKKNKDTAVIDKNDETLWWWVVKRGIGASFSCISMFALLVRVAVSLHPYSGAADPPRYGDFEAQRHWMEITVNLPIKDWYQNSTQNDLSYWGLDYPPLTAYQSYVHGLFLKSFLPESVALFTSRGHESYIGKLLMRWTVLSSDLLVFFPAAFFFIILYNMIRPNNRRSDIAWLIAMVLLNPCLIIIDHGHFQFNCISLGLTVGAIAGVLADRELLACALFSCALNHKQMSIYFVPAFFSHLLGRCLRRRHPLLEVMKLGTVVIGTFCVLWWPYMHSLEAVFQVLSRLAPFERGLYEDYVANFWCATSILIKWKKLFTVQALKLLCFGATFLTCLPSMIQQIRAPTKLGFLYGLLNSSFSFYLFSFQVHEKSILLPLLPATLLALEEPRAFRWLTQYALLSMFPLLVRDRLTPAYIAISALFTLCYYAPGGRKDVRTKHFRTTIKSVLVALLILFSLALHIIYLTISPPKKYPFLFEAMIMALCFSQFVLISIYTNTKQWTMAKPYAFMQKDKKYL